MKNSKLKALMLKQTNNKGADEAITLLNPQALAFIQGGFDDGKDDKGTCGTNSCGTYAATSGDCGTNSCSTY